MASITITGKEPDDKGVPREDWVPKKADYTVFSVPEETVIVDSVCSEGGAIHLDLTPGKYRIKVRRWLMAEGKIQYICNWERFFYVGMDEKTWKRIRFMRPRWVAITHTTNGLRYKCTLPGCSEYNAGKWGALLHEMQDHFGLDPMKATDEDLDRGSSASLPMSPKPEYTMPNMAVPEDTRRRPGRPRKNPVAASA